VRDISSEPAEAEAAPAPARSTIDDTGIQDLVTRLARPTKAGGHVIERAAILAEGSHCGDIEAWILRHGGEAEMPPVKVGSGLHADRGGRPGGAPTRYVLPAGALV
jgi:hypothetical protein